MGKTGVMILGIFTILSGIGNAIKIYEFWGKDMKIDVAWLIIIIIFASCILILLNEFRKDYQVIRKVVYQLFLESEGKKMGERIGKEIEPDIRKVLSKAINDGFAKAKKDLQK